MTVEKPEETIGRYLRQLDRAARWLPGRQADELHEQIASHLHESLAQNADSGTVNKALADLGQPQELVREAAGSNRRLSIRLRRVRWWTWTIAAVALAAVVTTITVVVAARVPDYTAADMTCSCGVDFVSRADADSARNIDAGTVQAKEVALRSNHQGFEFDIFNTSHVTQTVLGLASRPLYGYRRNYTLRIGTRSEHGFPLTNTTFSTGPVAVPPGQNREVILTWNHLPCSAPRVELIVTEVPLRVRLGSATRTENISLLENLIFKVPNPKTTTPASRCIPAAASAH
jgi:hypothetical protein